VSQKQSVERTSAGSGDNDERLNLKRVQHSQECISALISVQTLQTIYGLSSSNARLLLRSSMIVRFSTAITALNHLCVSTKLGVQPFGD
jgi:hypothetical protein